MFGLADFSAYCAAILIFLALPGPLCLAHGHRQGRLPRGSGHDRRADQGACPPAAAKRLEQRAGLFLIGFGIRLTTT
jgi:threonine/homoserine/homoserine lactone efflux protein